MFIIYSDTKQMNVYALFTCLFFNKHFITESYLNVKAIFTSTAAKQEGMDIHQLNLAKNEYFFAF